MAAGKVVAGKVAEEGLEAADKVEAVAAEAEGRRSVHS